MLQPGQEKEAHFNIVSVKCTKVTPVVYSPIIDN